MQTDVNPIAGIFLMPGKIHVAKKPTMVRTLLGSCVSMTIFSPKTGIGGITHALLPGGCRRREDRQHDSMIDVSCDLLRKRFKTEHFKYVDCSIHYLLWVFNNLGINRQELEVKLFGGADVLDSSGYSSSQKSIGRGNAEMALRIIEKERLNLVATHIGGVIGRKIIFYTHTGEVYMKLLDKTRR